MDPLAERATVIEFSDALSEVPNGAWTWFTDERAVVDADAGPDGPRVLVGVVTADEGTRGGDIVLLWHDVGSGETDHVTLHEGLEQDDHNGPTLFVRPDGRYLAMYAKHGTDTDTRWRVSTDPHDPTKWGPEHTLDNGAETTYCNVYHLPDDADGDGRTYCFTRTENWDPNVLVSTDRGTTWSYGGRLLERGDDAQRPYARYCVGEGRVHVTTTEDHPRDHDNGVYHGYVRDGTLFDSTGRVLADDSFDGEENAPAPSDLTTVFEPGTRLDGEPMTRAWTVDASVDGTGRPVAIVQVRARDDPSDHRFLYARFDGREWAVTHLARAGPGLYDPELDYTGLATVDPTDADRVVASTPIDPRDDAELDHHELFAGVTTDGGDAWEWTALTPDASTDNLRPLLPAWDGERTAVIWMRGRYDTYRQWETQVVGAIGRR